MNRVIPGTFAGVLALGVIGLVAQSSQTPPESKWDVAAPLGPTSMLSFDTDEATWVNVDVSPDGKTIAFDVLGDLYTMPIAGTGGQPAARITSGPAWDMQPRFSPDGRRIAFATDRNGATNIWTIDLDGKNPSQVSEDTKWFVNSPTWSPDGQYVFARRHFVKERSLGAGEVWMYHAAGSEGIQVTEKVSWQKDAGEPAISPDGRYLYYSKDVTPGENFEYNKNPYQTIYAIIERDLTTGKERRVVDRPGGAITPRPSPDGSRLAFIRRVDTRSVLFTHDLATGVETAVFEHLDKDLQEAWAVHGVYPQYAWTPDSASIVIWGEGRIWRVDVAARTCAQIPFVAHVEQTINDAVRTPQEVHPAEFPVRMLRDVTTSPDGKMVAYSALGHLYVKRLPDGAPARLTTDAALEYDPAFSRDGARIVYTTWTDKDFGRVRIVHADGSGGRDVVPTPGHYAEAAFSPDGKLVVFRSARPDGIRADTQGERPGIYVVDAEGRSAPRRLRESGVEPQFDHTGQRVYVRDRKGEKFVLLSIDLAGGDEVVHFQSDNAQQIVPSPDGKWVAFDERLKTYVAPFPRSGRPIDLGPKTAAFPVAQVARDTGFYLHWSGDSTNLHWSLGPDLFTRDLRSTFRFVDQGLQTPAQPEAKGVPIGFTAKSDVPEGAVAFVGARVVTMAGPTAGEGVIEDGTIIVEGNRITAVGARGAVTVPAHAHVVRAQGKTIMPGLIDVHAHVGGEDDGIIGQLTWPLAANLAFGVTTSHDPSNDTATVFTTAEMIRAGLKLGPRLFSTGTVLYGAETPFKAEISTYEDALSHLRRMKAVGAFSVKSYNQQRRDVRQMIIKAARELGMMVVPEGGSLLYMDNTMVLDGHTGIEHSLPVPNLYRDVVQLFAKSKSGYTPTLIVGYGGLSGEYYWYQHTNVWENRRLLTFVPRDVVVPRSRRREMAAEDDFGHIALSRGAKKIVDAGGSVQLGAHGQLQGLGAHWELWMLEQGGMTPYQALTCATIAGARYLGLDRDLGSLERGKLADLVVLDANPLESIRNSETVSLVMKNGRLYDANTLNEVGNHPVTRPPFYWQR